ncbi:MAG: hypothetical protein HYW79_00595 [Parcubacteria group bacterium]|nr:hypothetical protein [Parcubacteria group bacterium]
MNSATSAKKQKVILIIFDTYIAVIKNSVGSKLFRNLYAKVNGKKTDITRNGELSCAFYVSSILLLFRFIKEGHATVDSTVKDLKKSGWKEIKKPEIGSVIVWEKTDFRNGNAHKHIGFYIGGNKAISNTSKSGYPARHHFTFGGKRKIELTLWNPKLKRDL